MTFLFDNLGAALVAGGVILLLAFTQSVGRTTAVGAVEFSASRTTTGAFLEVLEQDLANVCAGVPVGTACIHTLTSNGSGAGTAAFEFSGVVDPVENAPVTRVRYEARPAGEVEVTGANGTTLLVPAFDLVRLVERGGVFEETARTAGSVTEYDVDLLNDEGSAVGAPYSDARVVAVRLTAAPYAGRTASLGGARFHRQFRLQHLAGA